MSTPKANGEILWQPSTEQIEQAAVTRFRKQVNRSYGLALADYAALHRWSVEYSDNFWDQLWDFAGIVGSKGDKVLSQGDQMPGATWFPRARLNYAENLLQRQDDHPAVHFWREDGRRQTLSYRQLRDQVNAVATAMRRAGVVPGDRVAGYLPNCPQTLVAMLASAAIGAVWSSCSPDFGLQGVLDRFGQIRPKWLFACDGYHYNGKPIDCRAKVQSLACALDGLEQLVWVPFVDAGLDLPGGALRFDGLLQTTFADEPFRFTQLPFDHPLFILYSSGTTGKPKAIIHGTGGTLLQHRKEHLLHCDLTADDCFFYFTTCGWMMWNWLASGLATGASLVLYDGAPFLRRDILWDMAETLGISVFGASAKYYSALEKAGVSPDKSHDLARLRLLLSTGSPLAPESFDYLYREVKADACLSSISGGTDIISCFALGNPTLPVRRGELQCLGLGMDVAVFNSQGQPVIDQPGELVCRNPFPCMPVGFWNDPDGSRYRSAYFAQFPGVWAHGDYATLSPHGSLKILGRCDAVLNPGGVRIGTAEIYRQVEKLPQVLESLAVGQRHGGDERILLFVVMRDGETLDDRMQQAIRNIIRENATPRHVPAKILQVPALPRTRSGKLTELAVRAVVHGDPVKNTEALANPEVLEYFRGRPELQE